MAKQKKNELDAILEQLKKSYATDMDSDKYEQTYEKSAQEDTELNSVLEKIFAENDANDRSSNIIDSEFEEPEPEEPEPEELEPEELESEEISYEDQPYSEVDKYEDDIEESPIGDITASCEQENVTDEQSVDNVLRAMLHIEADSDTLPSPGADDILKENNTDYQEISDDSETVDSFAESEAATLTCEFDEELDNENVENEDLENKWIDDEEFEDEDLEDDEYDSDLAIIDGYENIDDILNEDLTQASKIILSPEAYTDDPLQHHLVEMDLFKPHPDIVFEEKNQIQEMLENDRGDQSTEEKNRAQEQDVSLFLKFGYNDEINSAIGETTAKEILIKQESEKVPESHKIIHGFIGKEFSDKDQIPDIKKKYKRDKVLLSIRTVIVSLLAIIYLISDIMLYLYSAADYYIPLAFCEIITVLIISLFLCRKIFAGILGIVRFDIGIYSILSVLVSEYFLYNIATFAIYFTYPELMGADNRCLFGGIILIYIAFVSVCELMDAIRESGVFDMMTADSVNYTLEKQYEKLYNTPGFARTRSNTSHSAERSYKVRTTHFLSSYFKNTAKSEYKKANVVYILGIVPISAVLIGCLVSVLDARIMSGMNAALMVSFSALPLMYLSAIPLSDFLNYVLLKKKHTAFVGGDSTESYANAENIVFRDKDAIEITSYTDINPGKTDDTKKWLNISFNVFRALGGPMSVINHKKDRDVSNIDSDVVINSISENGIDLFFNSSMNVLIGDRSYMYSHNLKVKTDINLTAATKGVDKSVIYIAFDGIPKLAFIINSKIKSSFLRTVSLLEANDIRAFVKSYEPQVNDIYFEQNKGQNELNVSVIKSTNYEKVESRIINGGSVIADDPENLIYALLQGRKIIKERKTIHRINLWLRIIGLAVASVLCIINVMDTAGSVMMLIKDNTMVIFYLLILISLIPNLVYVFMASKEKNRNYKENK